MINDLFKAIDNKDGELFSTFLTKNCQFRFGNLPVVEGTDNILQFVSNFFNSIHSLNHHIQAYWTLNDNLICHGSVTYTRLDGSQLTVPFANVLKYGPEGIFEYMIFVDASALHQ